MPHILITGANRGIGLALTSRFLKQGANVWACCRKPANAEELQELQKNHPQQLSILELDVTSDESVKALKQQLKTTTLDVLINNAGIYGPRDKQRALSLGMETWREVLEVNTFGPIRVLQALNDILKNTEGSKVITITSTMGSFGNFGTGAVAYRTSKAAVNMAMRLAAGELKPYGVACVQVHPGWVKTEMGGANADLSVEEAVDGLMVLIKRVDIAMTGRFYDYRGVEMEW